ncbi:hypothetical protein PYCCODRAFT_1370869, partial [Trametes coccinea BRFM310]
VYVGDKKYACETCIKGHRSSSCKHTDRPLFEIKKKGRPVTQCEHCRELRKTRQIHVKCVCESKDGNQEGSSSNPGPVGQGVSGRAAFPSGLPPELLEASVTPRPSSEGSESDQSGRGCSCKDDASCTCWTPRHRMKQSGGRNPESRHPIAIHGEPISEPAALVINAHTGSNRPVLPKPPSERAASPFRGSHSPSSAHPNNRSTTHGQAFFSPYGRAYEYNHETGLAYERQARSKSPYPPSGSSSASSATEQLAYYDGSVGGWQEGNLPSMAAPPSSPSLCNCGSTCACPGCLQHNGPNVDPSASCANPATCAACLECNILSLTTWSSEVTQPMYEASQMQNPEDWLQQMSVIPNLITPPFNPHPSVSATSAPQLDPRYEVPPGVAYGGWNDPRTFQASQTFAATDESDCCGGRCKCPPGMCACPPDCCGCCQGCSCSGCTHDDGSGRSLTFATSGERAPCCGGGAGVDERDAWSAQPIQAPTHSSNSTFIASPSSSSSASTTHNLQPKPRNAPTPGSCCAPARPV